MKHRVAITGCGAVSALGNNVQELTESLRTGRSGVRLVAGDPAAPPVAAAFPLLERPHSDLCAADRVLFDPVTRYAMQAAHEALTQSGLMQIGAERGKVAVYVGTAVGGGYAIEEAHRDIWYHGTSPKPLAVLSAMSNAPASHLSIRFGLRGPNHTFSVACASSAAAIGEAFHAIRDGRIEAALAGGSEACVTSVMLRAWQAMRALASVDMRASAEACKPFARDRTGLVLAEGAAMIVLERLAAAADRGAPLLCELIGYGSNADGTHICIPSPEGQADVMLGALEDARLSPGDIDYLNAHGTGTRVGDLTETRAIRLAFGDHATKLAISSTKAAHGHALGAAGALELVASIAAIRAGFLPATLNLRQPDPECDLDFVPLEPRIGPRNRIFMSNSFAFGGANAVLIANVRAE